MREVRKLAIAEVRRVYELNVRDDMDDMELATELRQLADEIETGQ